MNDINNKPGRLCFEVKLTSAKGTPMSELCFEVKFFVYGHPKAVLFTRDTLTHVEGRYYALMDERTFVDGNLFCEAYVKDVVMRVNTGYVIGGHCACGQATTDISGGYTLAVNRVEKPSSSATAEIIAEELHGEKMHLPELLADRAISDEVGNRITDTYVTRHGLTNHIKATYNEQFLENPPLITDGYITPAMLSEDTKKLLEAAGTEVTNLPDGEDLESVHGVLKLANKKYNPNSYDGLGRQYIRRNVVNGVNTLVQSMVQWSNTLYIIRYDHDLQGRTITIPEGCTLMFESGKFFNGKVVLNDTQVRPYGCLVKDYIDCEIEGTFRKGQVLYSEEYKQTVVWTGKKWKCSYDVLFRVYENKLQQSVDDGETWENVSDYIASYFRFVASSSAPNSIGKIQISQDNKTWTDLSPEFTNYMRIADYVATTAELPKNAPQGIIYGVGPVDGSTYTLYVNTSKGWINNGPFASFTAGVVQETGDNENAVMSQKAVTEKFNEQEVKLSELGSEVGDRIEPYEDAVRFDEEDLYFCDKKGNIVAKIGANGINAVGFGSSDIETVKNGKDDFKITDSKGNIILKLSATSNIDDIVRIYLEKRYIKPALSWIDDDFAIFESDHGGNTDTVLPFYQDIHDWMLENDIRMDFAYIPSNSENRMRLLHQWEDENFRFLLHPKHEGWYAEYGNTHNPTQVRKSLVECIRHFKENNILTDCKILVWPGSSHKFADNVEIVKNYIDCGITAVGTSSNQALQDNRYNIQRLTLSISLTKTKTMLKAYIKECLDRGDWLILYTHLYNDTFVVSDLLDETSNTSANIKEIVSYANSLCKMRSTEEIWNERKFIYDYVKL